MSPAATSAPDVSVLLLSWNTRELTLQCLDSLPESVDDSSRYEVIVVDNGSQDGSAEALAQRDDIELVLNRENRGYAEAVNQAFERSSGEFCLLLNSDVEFRPGALSALLDFLRANPDVAGVGPRYLNPDGSPQAHHYRFPTFEMALAGSSAMLRRVPRFRRAGEAHHMLDADFSEATPVPQPSATCLLLRRSDLPADRILDEAYPIFFNDVVLARSLALRGKELWMTPDAEVFHERSSSTRQLGGALKRQYLGSLIRYLAETEPWYRVLLFRLVVLVQGVGLLLTRSPRALSASDLWGAIRGNPGPIPQAPRAAHMRPELDALLTAHGTSVDGRTRHEPSPLD
jgi:GT2 family glycosyltransferase